MCIMVLAMEGSSPPTEGLAISEQTMAGLAVSLRPAAAKGVPFGRSSRKLPRGAPILGCVWDESETIFETIFTGSLSLRRQ